MGAGMDRYRVPRNRITGLVTLTSKSPESRPKIVFRKCVEAEGGVVMDSMTIRIDMAGRHIVGGGVGSMDPDLFAACLDAIPHELEQ
ncbi:MAG: hypothetical protein IIB04_01315 [Acidobacteria bacterium]|nr:hypothetical protein [Acidobacteriota bacterium]